MPVLSCAFRGMGKEDFRDLASMPWLILFAGGALFLEQSCEL